jgi:hypothetical protein
MVIQDSPDKMVPWDHLAAWGSLVLQEVQEGLVQLGQLVHRAILDLLGVLVNLECKVLLVLLVHREQLACLEFRG